VEGKKFGNWEIGWNVGVWRRTIETSLELTPFYSTSLDGIIKTILPIELFSIQQ
jgi:hypothetical protein